LIINWRITLEFIYGFIGSNANVFGDQCLEVNAFHLLILFALQATLRKNN
jgi:hypothetical protein